MGPREMEVEMLRLALEEEGSRHRLAWSRLERLNAAPMLPCNMRCQCDNTSLPRSLFILLRVLPAISSLVDSLFCTVHPTVARNMDHPGNPVSVFWPLGEAQATDSDHCAYHAVQPTRYENPTRTSTWFAYLHQVSSQPSSLHASNSILEGETSCYV